jgi:hypothetical protein
MIVEQFFIKFGEEFYDKWLLSKFYKFWKQMQHKENGFQRLLMDASITMCLGEGEEHFEEIPISHLIEYKQWHMENLAST